MENLNAYSSSLLDSLETRVTLELGDLVLTVKELLVLETGAEIELEIDLSKPLRLTLNGNHLGEATLVRRDHGIVLQINSIASNNCIETDDNYYECN
ncbi:FliM/FliN family flagellar motor switch protein [bacterium]|nr:FliM/FliN family flagellar motor switch protein [bacterium]